MTFSPGSVCVTERNGSRSLIQRAGGMVTASQALFRARALAAALAPGAVVNLCEDRGRFLIAFMAALLAGRTTLLPPARTEQAIAETVAAHGAAILIDDRQVGNLCDDSHNAVDPGAADDALAFLRSIDPGFIAVVGYTSGSTGRPSANAKTWRTFAACTRQNLALLQTLAPAFTVLATVPSQHMYGMELAVLLPLLGPVAVADARPLFPQDLAAALARVPGPCVLVTTPVHLRAFVAAGIAYPPLAGIVSATAPLSVELARAAEDVFHAPLLETFGSTETCIIGHRRPVLDPRWQLMPGLALVSDPAGTRVSAPYFDRPVLLQDRLRTLPGNRFQVEGRCQDMIEIAGKRASLGDITARLLTIPGVFDAAAVQSPLADAAGVQRVCAIVVAADVGDEAILAALKRGLDPAFLPRRIVRVERLPRNDTGKLRRADLVALLK